MIKAHQRPHQGDPNASEPSFCPSWPGCWPCRPSWAASGSINVYNWSDYIGETTLADFTAETGVEVIYDLYASSEEAEAKILAGSTDYDLVIQSGMKL